MSNNVKPSFHRQVSGQSVAEIFQNFLLPNGNIKAPNEIKKKKKQNQNCVGNLNR